MALLVLVSRQLKFSLVSYVAIECGQLNYTDLVLKGLGLA
jgi:hypothetical protein